MVAVGRWQRAVFGGDRPRAAEARRSGKWNVWWWGSSRRLAYDPGESVDVVDVTAGSRVG